MSASNSNEEGLEFFDAQETLRPDPREPQRFTMRPHQKEAIEHAVLRNTIVNLPTGAGHTIHSQKMAFVHAQTHCSSTVGVLVCRAVGWLTLLQHCMPACMARCH